MEDCEYTSSSEDSETENELDDIRDIEDSPASRKQSVADNGSTILSGEKRSKKVTRVAKKRGITISTVEKWKRDYEKSLNTCLWLEYEKMDREYVSVLKCKVCKRFVDKIQSARNFNPAFINGSKNLHASAMKIMVKLICTKWLCTFTINIALRILQTTHQ